LRSNVIALFLAATSGALTAWLGFAPVGWWWVPFLGFAVLAALLQRAPSVKFGAVIGFVFGLGYFLAGVSWVRVSLGDFGGMPLPMAWFAAFLFCSVLAAFPLLAGAFTAWAKPRNAWFFAFVFACAWTFAEYLRAHVFTGFEWLSVGTSQSGGEVSFQPFIPLVGSFGVTLLTVLTAGVIARAITPIDDSRAKNSQGLQFSGFQKAWRASSALEAAVYLVVVGGVANWLLFSWTPSEPAGRPLRVSLLQGNVPQSMKWEPEKFVQTLQMYERLITQSKGELIILPETALPAPLSRIPSDYIERLRGIAFSKGANLLIGVPVQEQGKFYNAAVSLGVEDSQQYRKVHLVPFGEYMPLRGLLAWFYANLTIPMSDFSPGDAAQAPIKINGQTLGISICYEDTFARDVHRTLPDATLLVNMSNDAWFGKSAAAEQHLQLSQLRAIEHARPMLRANNTGITAVIDEKGRVTQRLEPFTEGILETTVQGRKGATPYMMWGDLPVLLMCLAGIGIGVAQRLRRRAGQEAS